MLFAAAAIVTAEVLLRKGVGAILGTGFVFSGSDEISSFLFAVGTSWSMAYVLVTRGHVRIDALYIHFSPRTRALLDLFALLVLGIFAAALLERSWDVAFTSYAEEIRTNSPQRLPLAWAQLPWFAGIALFFLALVLALLRSIGALLRGDYATAAAVAGAITQDEEIESELEGLGIQREQSGSGTRDDRDHAAAADHPARAQRTGCRRDGRAGAGAQPVLRLDAAAPRHGRDRLEHVERVYPDRHPAVRDAGRDSAALGHRRARLQRHCAMAVLAAGRPDARQHRHRAPCSRRPRARASPLRRPSAPWRSPRSRSTTTTSRCSSAPSPPAARSASSFRRRSTSSCMGC